METDIPDSVPAHWVDDLPTQMMLTDEFYRRMVTNPERRIPFLLTDA